MCCGIRVKGKRKNKWLTGTAHGRPCILGAPASGMQNKMKHKCKDMTRRWRCVFSNSFFWTWPRIHKTFLRSQECFVNSGSSSEERIAKYTSSPPGHVFAFVFHFILHAWGRSSEYAWSAMRRAGQSFIFPFTFDSDPTTHKLSFPLLRKL